MSKEVIIKDATKTITKLKAKYPDTYTAEIRKLIAFYYGIMQRADVRISSYVYLDALVHIEELFKALGLNIDSEIVEYHKLKVVKHAEEPEVKSKVKTKAKSKDKKGIEIIVDKRFKLDVGL